MALDIEKEDARSSDKIATAILMYLFVPIVELDVGDSKVTMPKHYPVLPRDQTSVCEGEEIK